MSDFKYVTVTHTCPGEDCAVCRLSDGLHVANAEIERLRAALREIAGLEVDPTYAYQVETIAREALGDE